MAANRDSPLEKIAQQVNCPICMEVYHHPKALSCLHTYCRDCIQKLVHHRSKDQKITCPQCRSDVPIAGNNVDSLPTVFFINELIDIYNAMKQASENTEIACQNCSEIGKAVAYCQSCDEKGLFICAKCEGAHEQMKAFAGHKVVSLADLKQGSLIHLPSKKTPTYSCSTHNGELKKLYCFTCSELICRDCTLLDHAKDSGHKYDFVNSVATSFKRELNVKLLPIQDTHAAVVQAVSQLETSKKAISEQGEDVKQRIVSAFNELQALLDEHKKLLLKQAEEAVERKMGMIEGQQNALKSTKSECESVIEFVKLTSNNAYDEEIVTMKESIESRLQGLADKNKHIMFTPNETAKMIVATPSVCEVDRLIKKQGFIAFLDGSDSGATTGKASLFKFRLVNAHNQPSIGTLTITAEVKPLTDHKSVIPATVSTKIPSVYEVAFTPQKRGRHQLMIRVNNSQMATFMIFVNHPPTGQSNPIRMIKSEATNYIWRIAVAENGDIFITQCGLGQFVCFNCNGSVQQIVKCVKNRGVRGIDMDSKTGTVFVSGDHKLQKYNSRGELVKEIGSMNPGAQPGEFHEPNDVRFYMNRVYICDSGNSRVQMFDPELNYINSFGSKGKEVGQFQWPEDIDFDTEGNIYVVDSRNKCVLMFSPTYRFLKHVVKSTAAQPLSFPIAIHICGDYVYVGDASQGVLVYHKSTGKWINLFSKNVIDSDGRYDLVLPVGVAIDVDGYVYVCQRNSHCVSIY